MCEINAINFVEEREYLWDKPIPSLLLKASYKMQDDAQDSTLEIKDEPIDTIFDIQETEIIFPVKEEPAYASETEENLEAPFTKLINTNPDLLHENIEISTKKLWCTYCEKQFGRADKLKLHEMEHTGKKRHACEVCGKSFPRTTYLKIHTNAVHEREKPFGCNLCNKSFAYPTSLSQHMKLHNRDKKFNCTICNYSGIRNRDIKSHMVKHTKESRFECAACGCQFVRADSLNRHVFRFCKGEPKMRTKSKNDENPETTDAEQE